MAAVRSPLRAEESGFSLLEVLVVMAIMAIMAGVAGLSVSGSVDRQARHEAERMQQALQMAADEAVFQGTEMGAYFTEHDYGFLRYDTQAHAWRPFTDKAMRDHALPANVRLAVAFTGKTLPLPKGAKAEESPAVIFMSSGEMTAFTATLSDGTPAGRFTLVADGLNPVVMAEGQ